MSASETYAKWRYRLVPDHLLGEVLSKTWIDNAIPFAFLIIVLGLFGAVIPNFMTVAGFSDLARQMGVMGLPVTIVVNPEGAEVGRLIGDAHWDSAEAQALLRALMAGG